MRNGIQEDSAVIFGNHARVQNHNDAVVRSASDQASDPLAEHQNRIRNRVFFEGTPAGGFDPLAPRFDQRMIRNGKRQFRDDDIA